MANCNDCININPIAQCAVTWVIGQVNVSYATSTLDYILHNTSTGNNFVGVTDAVAGDGTVTITLPDAITELMSHVYKLTLYEAAPDSSEAIEVTIDTEAECCIQFTTTGKSGTTINFSVTPCLTS